MRTETDRMHAFVVTVLDGMEVQLRDALRKSGGGTAPAESEDLRDWAHAAMERRTRRQRQTSKRWTQSERLRLYLELYRDAEMLRDIAALRRGLGNEAATEVAYRLLWVCADQGDTLKYLFTGGGSKAARVLARERRSENYWKQYLLLIPKAMEIRKHEPYASMPRWTTPVARRVIKGLTSAEWDDLTRQGKRTFVKNPNSEQQRARKFAELLRAWERVNTEAESVGTDTAAYFAGLNPIERDVWNRTLRSVGGFVRRQPLRALRRV